MIFAVIITPISPDSYFAIAALPIQQHVAAPLAAAVYARVYAVAADCRRQPCAA